MFIIKFLLPVLAGIDTFIAVANAFMPDPNPNLIGLAAGSAVMIALFSINVSNS